MADIITGTTTGIVDTSILQSEHADIRREGAEHEARVLQETMKGFDRVNADVIRTAWQNSDATKDARYDINSSIATATADLSRQVDAIDDTLTAAITQVSRDTMDLRSQVSSLGTTVRDNAQLGALQTEKAVLQNTIEGQKNTQYLSDKIGAENERTRALINDLKYHDLNRGLVERNTEIVELEADRRHWRHRADQNQYQGQWAQLQSQIQAFQSQLQETRQGMVNFGTMAGVGQSSTSNAVR